MALNLSPFSLAREIGKLFGQTEMEEPVARVESFYRAMKPIHEVYERQWFLNIANLAGNQWIAWDSVSRRFQSPQAPSWRVRLVVNKILPIARIQMAKLAERRKEFYVAPENSSDESLSAAAKAGTKYIKSILEGENFADLDAEIDSWLVSCGIAHAFVGYDKDEGVELEETIKNEAGEPEINPISGKPVTRKFKTGDLNITVDSPFEVLPDYSTIRWSEQRAVCRLKLRSVEYIKAKYDVEVSPETMSMDFSLGIRTMEQSSPNGRQVNLQTVLGGAVMLKDYYETPSPEYPKGRHIIVAGGKTLLDEELKTKRQGKLCLPVITYTSILISGRLMPMAPVEPLLPLQWEYNKTRSQIIEDNNAMGRPKLLCAIDSLAGSAYTDQPGEKLEYDPAAGPAPVYLNPPAVSSGKINSLERLDQEMLELGGVNDINFGRLPRRATSGFALSLLDEKDNTVMAPMVDSKVRGHVKLLSIALGIVQEEYMETRKVKIAGPSDSFEQVSFTGADIKGQHDVRVVPDDPFPTSRIARLEFAKGLKDAGILSPRTIRRAMKLNDFAELDDVLLDEEDQRLQAAAALPAPGAVVPGQPSPEPAPTAEDIVAELQAQGGLTGQGQ